MIPEQSYPDDPAAGVALSAAEIVWLGEFLASEEVPDTAMPLEALDGFFTALVVGPETVLPSEYMPVIWDTAERVAPVFADPGQLDALSDLLSRHWSTIARRVAAGHVHLPLLEDERPGQEGCAWCYGFMVGMGLRLKAWQPLLKDKAMGPLIAVIAVLAEADELSDVPPTLPQDRAEIVEALSAIPLTIRDFWRDRAAGLHAAEPLRSTKIGRNDPCPCGSGRKYKRCCGAPGRAPG
jgi:uncharacterized protein